MRNLTFYELNVLIKNEVNNMQISIDEQPKQHIMVTYIKARCMDILDYILEIEELAKREDE